MDDASYVQLGKGAFLVASPEVESPLFFRSVVLLCEHSPQGSFGIIINKHVDIDIQDELFKMEELTNPNFDFRSGGPNQANQMLIVHNSDSIPEQSIELLQGVHLGGSLEFLQNALLKSDGPILRLFFGYISWSAGQLEEEFINGQWFIANGSARHVFESPPEQVWRTILREMGGKYATLSMIPDDLSLN